MFNTSKPSIKSQNLNNCDKLIKSHEFIRTKTVLTDQKKEQLVEIQKTGMSSEKSSAIQIEEQAQSHTPKRVMGGFSATMIVVASMVGTGVFTTSGFLLETTPSASAVLISWLIGGIVAFFGALSYAELVSMFPQNGGEYQLLSKIFHPALGFIAGWISLIVGFSAPIASAAMAFGEYASNTFPDLNKFWAAVIVILLLSTVHAVRVTLGSAVQNFFTVLKIAIVSVFIIGGFALGDFSLISQESVTDTTSIIFSPAFAVGLIYITYAYTGWNGSAYIAGEVKNPTKSVPQALAIGTILVTLIYIGLNTVFLTAAPMSELTGKVDIGAVAAIHIFGESIGNFFSAIIALLLISSISAMIMEGPRIYQSVGDDYPVFHFLSKRKGESGPYIAIILQAIIAVLMMMTARFDELIMYIGFTLSLNSALTVAGVFVMRRKHKEINRPYRCWGYPVTPIIFIILSLWMIIFTIIQNPMVALAGGGTILSGAILYWIAKPRKVRKNDE